MKRMNKKRLFEVDSICRLCLRADEKVSILNNTQHKVFIESIIRLKQSKYAPTDDLYICYICSALLKKSFNFMQTIWSAQQIISAILKNTNMVTKQLLYCIDRQNTGLNPITLNSVVTYCDNVKCDSSDNTSSDSNTIADIEELDLDLLFQKEKSRKQKNPNMNKINYHSKNENKLIISNSDEDEESDKCNLDEIKVEMCNNFEISVFKGESSDQLTKELNTEEPIPETEKPVIKKNKDLKKSPSNENKLIISISDEDEESDKCNLDEMEVAICNNFKIEGIQTESGDPLTKELNTDEPIPETEKPVIKKNRDFKKSPSTENKHIISISDEDEESDKCNLDEMEVEMCNNFEIEGIQTESGDPLTKELNTDASDEPIPKTKKTVRKQSAKSQDSTSNKTKRKHVKKDIDYDYQPDSTSHSEDSDYDSYDDEGKTIKRPKDDRVYPMKCDHCDFEVLQKTNHYRHYQYMHPNIEYPYKHAKEYACSICGVLCTKQRIALHEANHTTQKSRCYFCPKVFSNMTRRQRHVLSVHPKRTFTCDYCSKIFKTKGDITRHFRTHTGSKPFKCHICGDGFAHSGNRSIHIRAKHQNYKYVPKKQKRVKKVRRNKKHCSTDTEISSSSEKTVRKTKTIRRSNNQSENTERSLKKKTKSTKQGSKHKEVGGTDTAMVSEDGKQNNKKKNKIQIVSDTNIEQESKNYKNAEIESDDEILAVIKRKNTQEGPQSKRAKQIDKENKVE